ncbi:hypothetical protein [Achromobacter sp. K91]|uniref:Bbp19 family protein n=1 Tax=Achromobacter sp. K91 TaxID=2292262 RepID=UPI0011C3A4C0|nr:hypothetical protein [Achromobacter sp. K91]
MTAIYERMRRMFRLRKAYAVLFKGEGGMSLESARAVVLADIARFSRADTSTVVVSPVSRVVDTHATMLAEGRREVHNRIKYYSRLTEDEIHNLKERANEEA